MLKTVEAAQKDLAERCLRDFVRLAWPIIEPGTDYLPNWHIDAICEYLEAVDAGQITRLVINIPPRYGKSILVSVMWPVRTWIKWPESRWLFASYAQDLATMHSMNRRRVITSEWYQGNWGHDVRLADDANLKTEYSNTRQGVMTATSIDGTATGKGGDRVVLDDPHNPKKAESDTERTAAVRNFDLTFSTRLNDKRKGAIVIVMQRLHIGDLSGHCLDLGYEHLCLPCEAKPKLVVPLPSGRTLEYGPDVKLPSGRVIERKPGDLMWPEREGRKELDAVRLALGSYGYAGQYDQTPSPDGGGKFQKDWFRYFDRDGEALILHTPTGDRKIWMAECLIFQTADLAMSLKETADYTVCGTWAKTRANELLLLDIDRFRKEAPEVKAALKQSREKWRPTFQGIERAHYGVEVCQQWLRDGIPLKELIADKDKVTRSIPAQLLCENGRLYFLARAPWLADLETELTTFPVGAHDDQVDVVSYAAQIVGDGSYSPPPLPKPKQATGRPDPNDQIVIQ